MPHIYRTNERSFFQIPISDYTNLSVNILKRGNRRDTDRAHIKAATGPSGRIVLLYQINN